MINVTENRRGNLSILDNPETHASLGARHITKTNKQNLGKKRAIRAPPTIVEGDVKLHQ